MNHNTLYRLYFNRLNKIVKILIFISIVIIIPLYPGFAQGISITNLLDNEEKSGVFQIFGNLSSIVDIKNVAVKVNNGPWESVNGLGNWNYELDYRQVVIDYEYFYDPGLNQFIEIYERGPYYGQTTISAAAFNESNQVIDIITRTITIIPETPQSGISSGTYHEDITITLTAKPEVLVYYTTNGEDPETDGTVYTNPFILTESTIVNAVAVSGSGLASNILTLNIIIDKTTPPFFGIQYFSDFDFTTSLGDNPYLMTGTYYVQITASKQLQSNPTISINAEGVNNDVTDAATTVVSGNIYRYARIITDDASATGDIREDISITGTDLDSNTSLNVDPVNEGNKAGYTDTIPPGTGSITVIDSGGTTNDLTPVLNVSSTGAAFMRFALLEADLSFAGWVTYTPVFDGFNISPGGDGVKTIWVEYKDLAGNIQPVHSSDITDYSSAITSFDIEYYSDNNLTNSLGSNPYLRDGTYYMKIESNNSLAENPVISIDAEGLENDVTGEITTLVSGNVYMYTRIILPDIDATGSIIEDVSIDGIDPSNEITKAAYTDTTPPFVDAGGDIPWTNTQEMIDATIIEQILLSSVWEKAVGKGTIIFGDETAIDTTIMGLPGEENSYGIRLFAFDAAGNTGSDSIIFNWDDKAPDEVSSLSGQGHSSAVLLQWVDPIDADYVGAEITWTPTDGMGQPVTVAPGVETLVITGLTDDTEYTFTVRTYDGTNNYSTGQTITSTPVFSVPQEIINAQLLLQDNAFLLSWDEPAGYLFDYVSIEWTPVHGISQPVIVPGGVTTTTITGLFHNTEYTITLKTIDYAGNESTGIHLIDTFLVTPAAIPHIEDFESGFGLWENITGDTDDFIRNSGSTPSGSTGPNHDNTSGSGYYIYMETSSGYCNSTGDTVILESPYFDADAGDLFLSFYYHMYGSNTGTLNVDVFDTVWNVGVWSINGQQHLSYSDDYTFANVDLSSYSGIIKLRLRCVAAGEFAGDIAIDDINVYINTDYTPPADVSNLSIQELSGTVSLNWTDPSDTDYMYTEVTWTPVEGMSQPVTVAKGEETLIITGLTNDTEYTFTVRTSDIFSNYSTGEMITGTPVYSEPQVVTNLTSFPGYETITLNWSDPVGVLFDYIEITWIPADGESQPVQIAQGVEEKIITGLNMNTLYDITINTVDYAGNSSTGIIENVSTLNYLITVNEDFETGIVPVGWEVDWEIDTESSSGLYSLKSKAITHSETSSVEIRTDIAVGSAISFSRKVSSETSFDYLRFYIDGVLQESWSGELDWLDVIYILTVGTHIIEWQYRKDGSVNSGSDCAWIDNVMIYEDTLPPAGVSNLSVQQHSGALIVSWTDPADPDYMGAEVAWIPADGISQPVTVAPGVETVTVTGLTNDTEYTFTVRTYDIFNNYSTGQIISGTPIFSGTQEVFNEQIVLVDNMFTLSWDEPPGYIYDYISIEWTPVYGPPQPVTVAGGVTTIDIEGFQQNTEYTFTIKTVDYAGNASTGVHVSDTYLVTVASVPYVDDFETGFGQWENETGDTDDFIRNSGSTPSGSTGPNHDNTSGSGYYIYMETSSGYCYDPGDTVYLESPYFDADTNDLHLFFYYHMYGSNIGSLNVDVFDTVWNEGVWSISGQQHISSSADFTQASIDLSGYSGMIKLRFRCVAAGEILGDIALDDISIYANDYSAPAEVSNLSVQEHSGAVVLNWTDPADPDYTGTEVTWTPADGMNQPVNMEKGEETLTVTGLTNITEYTFTVRTYDIFNMYSSGQNIAGTPIYSEPQDVTNITSTPGYVNNTLNWDDPAGVIFNYVEITWTPTDGESQPVQIPRGEEQKIMSGLSLNTNYEITITTVDYAGNSSTGIIENVSTLNYLAGVNEGFETGTVPVGWYGDWEIDTESSGGVYDLKSKTITHSETSNVEIRVNIAVDSVISFSGKVSSQAYYDYFRFYIDGASQNTWSGEMDWFEVNYMLTAGTHTLMWRYSKNSSTNSGSDCAWIDNVIIYEDTSPPPEVSNLSVQQHSGLVVLNWTDPVAWDYSGIEVTWAPADGMSQPVTVAPGEETVTITGLTNDTLYTFTVRTYDLFNNYSSGQILSGTPIFSGTQEVINEHIELIDDNFRLSWDEPAGYIFDYISIEWTPLNGPPQPVTVPAGVTFIDMEEFQHNTEYTFTIKTVDYAGNASTGVQVTDTYILPIAPVPYVEDFEIGLGQWVNETGDTDDFIRNSGSTPSTTTGPDHDNTSGGGYYIYMETSSGNCYTAGDTVYLESPYFDASTNDLHLFFHYHMYGSEIGSLNVDVFETVWNEGVWSISGQQHLSSSEDFTQANIDLSGYSGIIKLRFRCVAAGGYIGDIAIDDISIYAN